MTAPAHGEPGTNLAELGVGTNDRARLTGNVLEDEKILGTVHVAFGASAAIGGTVSVPIHLDVVVLNASLEIDGRPVLEDGELRARRAGDVSSPILLAVPNVSEGRDREAVGAIAAAFDARLLDVHTDPDHHRSVFTLAGAPGRLAGAVAEGAAEALPRIDLDRHHGDPPPGRRGRCGADRLPERRRARRRVRRGARPGGPDRQ